MAEPIESAHDAARQMAKTLLAAGYPPSKVVAKVEAAYGLPEVARTTLAQANVSDALAPAKAVER
jgi:hypothetical protein